MCVYVYYIYNIILYMYMYIIIYVYIYDIYILASNFRRKLQVSSFGQSIS